MTLQEMEALLATAVGSLEQITIEIVGREKFVWRVFSDGREILAIEGDQAAVAGMLQSTEVMINTQLGVAASLLRQPNLN